jgi:predicted MPP superfamily phosphohydrolase
MGFWAAFVLLSLALEPALFFSAQARAIAAAAAAAALSMVGFWQALRGPLIKEVSVPIAGLPQALRGLRVAQISDLHVGSTIQRGYVQAVVDRLLSLKPDMIAITGDLVDGKVEDLAEHVEPLRGLHAPLGVYYVTGNHEYYWGAPPWVEKVRELGMRPLIDEGVVVSVGEAKVLVAGVTDMQSSHFVPAHRSDARQAAAAGKDCDLKILLAHRPNSCVDAQAAGFDLQLSGHTHGGQFFPFSLLVRLGNRYLRGLNRHGSLWVYVSSGTGYWGPPNRFLVSSEITILRLEPAGRA